MRVIVDQELCQGHAQCEDVAPQLFHVGDDAIARVLIERPGEDLRAKAEEAVRMCPAEAITIVDD